LPDFSGNGDLQLLPSLLLSHPRVSGRLPGHDARRVGAGSLPGLQTWARVSPVSWGMQAGAQGGVSHGKAPIATCCWALRNPLQQALPRQRDLLPLHLPQLAS